MKGTIPKTPKKSTFRRLDKYLYVARTMGQPPALVVAVCVMANSGRRSRTIASDLGIPAGAVKDVLVAAEPFLRKRKTKP